MKKAFLVVALLSVALALPATARATSIAVSIGNTSSGFVGGQTVTSAAMLAAQSGKPAPFNGPCGSDAGANCTTSWTFNYIVPGGEIVTSASLVVGLSDIDSAAANNQVALYQIVGGDVLTAALNAAAESLNGGTGAVQNEYDVFTFALSSFTALNSGSVTVQLALQAPGLGVIGPTNFNGASLLFSTLNLTTTPNGNPNNPDVPGIPEPTTLLLVATGLGAAVRRRRHAKGARG
jgi:hypothetical protein